MSDAVVTKIDLSLLICTHNRGSLLERTLASIDEIRPVRGVSVEVVVIANACTDDTVAVAGAWAAASSWDARIVVEPRPGLSIARNRAIDESTGSVCAYLDDDVLVDPGWLEGMSRTLADESAMFGGGKILLWWEEVERPEWFTRRLDSLLSENDHGDEVRPIVGVGGVVGANFWVRRKLLDKVGNFREDLGRSGKSLVGGEESDLIMRAHAAGMSGIYCPDVQLKHWVPASRVNREYLTKVAAGNAYGRIRMRPRMGLYEWLRCLIGHIYLLVLHSGLNLVRRIRHGRDHAIHEAAAAAKARAALRALWDRQFAQDV